MSLQIDAMLVQASGQDVGSAARRRAYEEIQRKLMDAIPFVGVMTQVRVTAMAAKVRNFQFGADGLNATCMNGVSTA